MEINKQIQRQIKDKTFALANHPVFAKNPNRLMEIGVNKASELAKRRIGNNTSAQYLFKIYNTFLSKITIAESNHKEELEKMAEETIREMYNVPAQIDIKPKIVDQFSLEYDFESQEEDKKIKIHPDRLEIIKKEANKRIILNSIVNGSSAMIWSSAYYIVKEKLDRISPRLTQDYDAYSSIVNCLLWMQEPTMNVDHLQSQGVSRVKFEDGLESEGVNFPVLLLETNKVVMDYLICKGIPKDFSEDELKLYYSLADDYGHEIWHNILSPVLYTDFLESIDTETENIPKIISRLSKLKYEKLKDIFIDVQENKEEAKNKLKLYNIC